MRNDKLSIVVTIMMVILNAFVLVIGISEAIFVAYYNNYKHDCIGIWNWMMVACVINNAIPILSCCSVLIFTDAYKRNNERRVLNIFHVGSFLVSVWVPITYFYLNSSCYDLWHSNAHLWTFIMIHFVTMLVAISFIGLCIFIACCSCYIRLTQDNSLDLDYNDIYNHNRYYNNTTNWI